MVKAMQIHADPNLAYLDAELRLLRLRLEALACEGRVSAPDESAAETRGDQPSDAPEEMKALEVFLSMMRKEAQAPNRTLQLPRVASAFLLNEFEQQLLLLAAAPDLDEGLGERIARVQGTGMHLPSVSLAWRLFCPSREECILSRDSLREDAPLLRFHLIELVQPEAPLPDRLVRADRRIADALVGRMMADARITPLVRTFWPSHAAPEEWLLDPSPAEQLTRCIQRALGPDRHGALPLIVQLHGATPADREAVAARALAPLGLPLLAASAGAVPISLARVLVRESVLLPAAVFVEGSELDGPEGTEWARALADGGPITFVASDRPLRPPPHLRSHTWLPVAVPRPGIRQRIQLWETALAPSSVSRSSAVASLADNFDLTGCEIKEAVRVAAQLAWFRGEAPKIDDVVDACRMESRHKMTELAQRLETLYGWEDLLLPTDSIAKLRELCAQVRGQMVVLEQYGFATRLSRGRGVTALFAGPSGTGKTMAAEVVARDLSRELYRVDLAGVVSKYIGETEKNLRRVFEEAERARCVVLFDEADALFGRRTEVRDSHDRYANIEVSYLLQWLEEIRSAVVLLATNRREAIDEAFTRRFRFLVDFPLPDVALRRKLWDRSFPPQVKIRDVCFDLIAERLPLSGASIRNIALAAAYLAAADGGVVGPGQIVHVVRRELEKLGRPMPINEADLRPGEGRRGGGA